MNAFLWGKKTDYEKKEYCAHCVIDNNHDLFSINRINFEINLYRDYYYREIDLTFEETIFKYLNNLEEYNFAEYKFYCWLCNNKKITPKINTPFNDFSYTIITENKFKIKYVNNEIRKNIYTEFENMFSCLSKDQNYDKSLIEVIVGGSFVRNNVVNPNDIDFAICISEELFRLAPFGNEPYFKREKFSDSKKIDFTFFPTNYNVNNYYIYSKLIMLRNIPKRKEKEANKDPMIKITNNEFKKNEIIRFEKIIKF